MVGRIAISIFAVLNIFTVLYMNTPPPWEEKVKAAIEENFDAYTAHRLRYSGWLVWRYAHFVGLDNRWEMFGRQSRFLWSYVIKARYANGKEVVLPLAAQSERSFFEHYLFDFKDAKIHLNIYPSKDFRAVYGQYLARQFPTHEGSPVEAIVYDLKWQNLYGMKEARIQGTHLDGPLRVRPLQEVRIR